MAIIIPHRLMGCETSVTTINEGIPNPAAFIYLKVERDMKKIYLNEIEYIESWKDYVKIYLTEGRNFLVKRPISVIESLLSDHKFMRVHRSYIVSLDKIAGYNGLSVQVSKQEIPIGRLYKQAFMERLQSQ